MKFRYRNKISLLHIVINLVVLTGFFYFLLDSNKVGFYTQPISVSAYYDTFSVLKEDIPDDSTINVNNIFIDKSLNWVITYIVQPGDTLSKIAVNFGVTSTHLKNINHLKSDIIKPWQKIKITDEDGIFYESKWETVKQLASKFKISASDIVQVNWLDSINYKFDKWDEIFIPISQEKYNKLFPHKVVKTKQHRPIITRVKNKKPKNTYKPTNYAYRWKNIVAKYWYRPNISNGFYRWHCTRYVAIKKFPYINAHKQKKLWNWNAKYWYANAAKAWYPVWKTPKVWAIVVIRIWWRHYYYAGHVAIVRQIDWVHRRILVEEMNALWKFIVTKRWIPMNSNIIGYIYI